MKTVEHEAQIREDRRRMSAAQLERLGVQVLNRFDLVLKCNACGESWSARLDANGLLPAGYWHCPNRCNN